jgi:hypothetical protein
MCGYKHQTNTHCHYRRSVTVVVTGRRHCVVRTLPTVSVTLTLTHTDTHTPHLLTHNFFPYTNSHLSLPLAFCTLLLHSVHFFPLIVYRLFISNVCGKGITITISVFFRFFGLLLTNICLALQYKHTSVSFPIVCWQLAKTGYNSDEIQSIFR